MNQDHIYDIVVIGGGGSGLVAAARAAEFGKRVLVLEKTKVAGGGMLFASTMRTFRSRWQEERGIPDQSQAFIRQGMDLTLWQLEPSLVRNAILGTGQFFDWYSQYEKPEVLESYQAKPYVFDIAVNGQLGPQLDGFHNGSGRVIMATMLRRCQELGVEILLQHRAMDVETDGRRITAVRVESPNGPVSISCRCCILACGSWIRNTEVLKKVLPAYLDADIPMNAHQNPAYTGDGLILAEKAGAFVDWDSFCLRLMGPLCSLGEKSRFDGLTHSNYAILVDLNAKRFLAESPVPRMDPFDVGHILLKHPKGKSFFLYSANTLRQIIQDSRQNETDSSSPFAMPPLPDFPIVDGWFQKETRKAARAETIPGLAEQLGLDPVQLKKTVDEYNVSCVQGADWNYFKDPAYLLPLDEGPFYALEGVLSTDGAFGGVRVNSQMQAYRSDGSLAEGLYVTGDFASGRHIVQDGIKRQVLNDMSWALSSGFLAGSNAAQALEGSNP